MLKQHIKIIDTKKHYFNDGVWKPFKHELCYKIIDLDTKIIEISHYRVRKDDEDVQQIYELVSGKYYVSNNEENGLSNIDYGIYYNRGWKMFFLNKEEYVNFKLIYNDCM